ncbi:MAG: phosphocholine cytidylyltransferase family protein [Sporichthyaceae bacterium]
MSNAYEIAQCSDQVQVVILAAGMGTRLGRPMPKPLTPLASGRPIMAHQLDNIRAVFGNSARITAVVGFKKEMIMETFPWLLFAYNERFDTTNTSQSLLRALKSSAAGGVLWLNGDVVFDHRLLVRLKPLIRGGESFVCVNTSAVGEEEVKYTRDPEGLIEALSKTVVDGEGEAVGINYVAPRHKAMLIEHLTACADQDYFERGLETAIAAGMAVLPVDISDFYAVEVDFEADLARANSEAVAGMNRAGYGPRIVAPRAPSDSPAPQARRRG